MEVYANGKQCITQRLFPTKPDATGVSVLAASAPATVHTLNAWDMKTTNGVTAT